MSITRVDPADGTSRAYSAAALLHDIVFACGQVPVDRDGTVPSSMADQVSLAIDNLESVLLKSGSALQRLLQVTVYLADLAEFETYNDAYLDRLRQVPLPPRTTIQVGGFRGDKRIEISAIAARIDSTSDRHGEHS